MQHRTSIISKKNKNFSGFCLRYNLIPLGRLRTAVAIYAAFLGLPRQASGPACNDAVGAIRESPVFTAPVVIARERSDRGNLRGISWGRALLVRSLLLLQGGRDTRPRVSRHGAHGGGHSQRGRRDGPVDMSGTPCRPRGGYVLYAISLRGLCYAGLRIINRVGDLFYGSG